MEGFFPSPFLGVEGWSGASENFWSGVRKGVKLRKTWSVPKPVLEFPFSLG